MDNQEHIEDLLVAFSEQRDEIKTMLDELEELKRNIDALFPKSMDKRHRIYFEEKVKAATSFFNVLLDMRKEIIRSIKDEIEMRRRIEIKDKSFDFEEYLDVRKMAEKVETFKEKTNKIKEKRNQEGDEVIPEDVQIPGVNSPVR